MTFESPEQAKARQHRIAEIKAEVDSLDKGKLRDQFAMAALGSVIECTERHAVDDFRPDFVATVSYLIADAMIKERDNG